MRSVEQQLQWFEEEIDSDKAEIVTTEAFLN